MIKVFFVCLYFGSNVIFELMLRCCRILTVMFLTPTGCDSVYTVYRNVYKVYKQKKGCEPKIFGLFLRYHGIIGIGCTYKSSQLWPGLKSLLLLNYVKVQSMLTAN